MNLSSVLNSARSALDIAAAQTSVVSRNVALAGDEGATRRSATTSATGYGTRLATITRNDDPGLRSQALSAGSQASRQAEILGGFERLRALLGGESYDRSAATAISRFQDALTEYAVNPADGLLADGAVQAARDAGEAVSGGASGIAALRRELDQSIRSGVDQLNGLLTKFGTLNAQVTDETRLGRDPSDAMDARDTVVREMSDLLGIKTRMRGDNDMVLFTDGGAILFETRARTVTVDADSGLSSDRSGGSVRVDGVPVLGPGARMESQGGALSGLVEMRDGAARQMQVQYDEMARGLVLAFAESDRSNPATKPDVAGLFVISGVTDLATLSAPVAGLAERLTINLNVDPALGGNPALLRDGGIGAPSDPDYRANATGAVGFSGNIADLQSRLKIGLTLSADAGFNPGASIVSAAETSVGWLEQGRSRASDSAAFADAYLLRAGDALTRATGINLDQEMSRLLELEKSYAAAARLISSVDAMFAELLGAVR